MKTIGIIILLVGIIVTAIGIWRRKNPASPGLLGNSSEKNDGMYGIKQPGMTPIIIGMLVSVTGFIFLIMG